MTADEIIAELWRRQRRAWAEMSALVDVGSDEALHESGVRIGRVDGLVAALVLVGELEDSHLEHVDRHNRDVLRFLGVSSEDVDRKVAEIEAQDAGEL